MSEDRKLTYAINLDNPYPALPYVEGSGFLEGQEFVNFIESREYPVIPNSAYNRLKAEMMGPNPKPWIRTGYKNMFWFYTLEDATRFFEESKKWHIENTEVIKLPEE